MIRQKINRLLNPKSKNTDQLGLCGRVFKVPKPLMRKRFKLIEVKE